MWLKWSILVIALVLLNVALAFAVAPEFPFKSTNQFPSIPGLVRTGSGPTMCEGGHTALVGIYADAADPTRETLWDIWLNVNGSDLIGAYFPVGQGLPAYVYFGTYVENGRISINTVEPFNEEKHLSPCQNWSSGS